MKSKQNNKVVDVPASTTATPTSQPETGHYKFAQEFIVKGKSHEEIMAFIRSIGDPQAAADLPALCMVKPISTHDSTTPDGKQMAILPISEGA